MAEQVQDEHHPVKYFNCWLNKQANFDSCCYLVNFQNDTCEHTAERQNKVNHHPVSIPRQSICTKKSTNHKR